MVAQKTYMAKPNEVTQDWWLIDAAEKGVGHLASKIAVTLMGKDKPTYIAGTHYMYLQLTLAISSSL